MSAELDALLGQICDPTFFELARSKAASSKSVSETAAPSHTDCRHQESPAGFEPAEPGANRDSIAQISFGVSDLKRVFHVTSTDTAHITTDVVTNSNTNTNTDTVPKSTVGSAENGTWECRNSTLGVPKVENPRVFPCAEKIAAAKPVRFGERDALIAKIKTSDAKYALVEGDPHATMFRIIILCLSSVSESMADEKASMMMRLMRFNTLFGADEDWQGLFDRKFQWVQKNQKHKFEGRKVLSFILDTDIRYAVPETELVVPAKDQRLKYAELVFVAKMITSRVFKKNHETSQRRVAMARDYFLCDAVKRSYRERTKRSLNPHKIAAIIEILCRHGFIDVQRVRVGKKYRPTRFGLGSSNFYFKHLEG